METVSEFFLTDRFPIWLVSLASTLFPRLQYSLILLLQFLGHITLLPFDLGIIMGNTLHVGLILLRSDIDVVHGVTHIHIQSLLDG